MAEIGAGDPGATPVAVVGGGIMGRGIAACLAVAGHPVAVVETDPAADALAMVSALIRAQVSGHAARAAVDRVRRADLEDAVPDARLVIEAVPEVMTIKAAVWSELGRLAAADATLATNTSAFSIDAIAALVPEPSRVIGTHWFNPAQIVPCVEVVTGSATDPSTVARVVAILTAAGKEPSVVRNSPGFVANRIQFAMIREALLCIEEGIVDAQDLDRIVSGSFGVRLAALGPLANADLGGLDTYRSILTYLAAELGERFAPPSLLERLVDEGRLGTKAGAGIMDYPGNASAELAHFRDAALARVLSARASVPSR